MVDPTDRRGLGSRTKGRNSVGMLRGLDLGNRVSEKIIQMSACRFLLVFGHIENCKFHKTLHRDQVGIQ